MLKTIAVVALVVVAGCAKRANSIAPSAIPSSAYSNLSCDGLRDELASERSKLAIMSKSQDNAATADAVGVFLVGVPAASLTGGDNEGDVAVSKGKVVAIEANVKRKGC